MSAEKPKKRIGELLVLEGLVTAREVEKALEVQVKQGGKLVEILLDLGYLKVYDFERFLTHQPGIASVDLTRYKLMRELCDLIPEDLARKHEVFPIAKLGKLLTVGMAVPLDTATINEIANVTGLRVKGVYCKPEQIRGAIDAHYGWRVPAGKKASQEDAEPDVFARSEPVDKQEIFHRAAATTSVFRVATLLQKIDDLPSLPQTVQNLKVAVDDPDVPIDNVIGIIEADPMVAVKLLRLANSAAYNLPRRIDNVGTAVKLLGLRETYNVALASTVLSMVESAKGFRFKEFWQEAMFSAAAAPKVALAARVNVKSGLSTAGLLHDIGRFALAQIAPDRYAKVPEEAWGRKLVEWEVDAFGLGHDEAGYVLAFRWDLPSDIVAPIRYHHSAERADAEFVEYYVTSIAAFLGEAHAKGKALGEETNFDEVGFALWKLSLAKEALIQISADTASELNP